MVIEAREKDKIMFSSLITHTYDLHICLFVCLYVCVCETGF